MTLRWLDRVVESALALALLALVVVGAAQVFWRFALGSPLTWSLEASILLLVWATMLSGYVGVRRDSHLSADFMGWTGSPRARWWRDLLALVLSVVFVAVYGISSLKVIDAMEGISFTSIPVGQPVLYWSLPASAVLMAVAFAARLHAHWAARAAVRAA